MAPSCCTGRATHVSRPEEGGCTADDIGSTVPRRHLGWFLREMRERERISHDSAASALDCSRQKIWRIEKGAVPVRAGDVRLLCDLYGASERISHALAALAAETRTKGWWHAYGDAVPAWFSLYVSLETVASRLRHYNGELVPGLLQTRRYADGVSKPSRRASNSAPELPRGGRSRRGRRAFARRLAR
ncbi:Scr1 family TA system antitoxin-like transcriptional regulator [Plantactinospora sp. WMMB334]|uniref:helix-turn-helix domain-containing protein n=1 Tax=Plantactinospora sp. WMMB334 TaxID=3404119 RepID=UPI003B93303E